MKPRAMVPMTTQVDRAHSTNVEVGLSGRKSPKLRDVSQKHSASSATRASPDAASDSNSLRLIKTQSFYWAGCSAT